MREFFKFPSGCGFEPTAIGEGLIERSVQGGTALLAAQGVKFLLKAGSLVFLARLLTPADFGLIAMVAVVISFADILREAGLTMASIQRTRLTHEDLSTLFWINVALSFATAGSVSLLAPVIAWFFGQPELTWITIALSTTLIISGVSIQYQALLRRRMMFGWIAAIDIAGMLAGIGAAILLTWLGQRYWALAGMTVVSTLTVTVLSIPAAGWIPGLPANTSAVRELLRFGKPLLGVELVNYISRNADNCLIGWWWGPAPLGVYSRAYALLLLPLRQVNGPISAAVLPALCRLRDNPHEYRELFCRGLRTVSLFSIPLCGFVFVVADALTVLMLGEAWKEVAPVFRALAPAAVCSTLNVASGWLAVSTNQGTRQFIWTLSLAVMSCLAFAIGLPWGPTGVAISYSAVYCALRWPGIAYLAAHSPIMMRDVYRAVSQPLFATLLATSIGFHAELVSLRALSPAWRVGLETLIFIGVLGCAFRLMRRFDSGFQTYTQLATK